MALEWLKKLAGKTPKEPGWLQKPNTASSIFRRRKDTVIKVVFTARISCYDTQADTMVPLPVSPNNMDGAKPYEMLKTTLKHEYGNLPDLGIWYLFKDPQTGETTSKGITEHTLIALKEKGIARTI
jgi:hypothetical protein